MGKHWKCRPHCRTFSYCHDLSVTITFFSNYFFHKTYIIYTPLYFLSANLVLKSHLQSVVFKFDPKKLLPETFKWKYIQFLIPLLFFLRCFSLVIGFNSNKRLKTLAFSYLHNNVCFVSILIIDLQTYVDIL